MVGREGRRASRGARGGVRAGRVGVERLDEVLNGLDPEAALNQFWKAVDQAYGKPTEHVQVSAGPIPVAELETWSDERIEARLKELEAESEEDG